MGAVGPKTPRARLLAGASPDGGPLDRIGSGTAGVCTPASCYRVRYKSASWGTKSSVANRSADQRLNAIRSSAVKSRRQKDRIFPVMVLRSDTSGRTQASAESRTCAEKSPMPSVVRIGSPERAYSANLPGEATSFMT